MKRTFLDSDIEKFNRDFKSFVEKQLNYSVFESFVAKAVAKTSGEFSKEIKKEVPRFFKTFSQKKMDSITGHRGKEKKQITYHVGAGEGISGHLNFLAGLYRGHAKTKSGKEFSYKKPRDIITEAKNKYRPNEKFSLYFGQYMKELQEK